MFLCPLRCNMLNAVCSIYGNVTTRCSGMGAWIPQVQAWGEGAHSQICNIVSTPSQTIPKQRFLWKSFYLKGGVLFQQ